MVQSRVLAVAAVASALACTAAGGLQAPYPRAGEYAAYVVSESADEVARVRFDGTRAIVDKVFPIGAMPLGIDGPHGVAVSPDGRYVYVSIAHGRPNGALWKLASGDGRLIGRTQLGRFPATVGLTPDGEHAFVSNFNLHGDPTVSTISKVHLPSMTEVARVETCVMPHGSRVDPSGTLHYSTCMMDDRLVEIETSSGAVTRTLSLGGGHLEHTTPAPISSIEAAVCAPTWAQPSADGRHVYVACSAAGEILEIEVAGWTISRRIPTGTSPYNLEVTPDGRYLLVTLRRREAPGLTVIELTSGAVAARIPSSTTLTHGVAATPDSRFAFVTSEGIGSTPGSVDVVDLEALALVATVEVGPQATGVAVVPGR